MQRSLELSAASQIIVLDQWNGELPGRVLYTFDVFDDVLSGAACIKCFQGLLLKALTTLGINCYARSLSCDGTGCSTSTIQRRRM